MLRVVVDSNVYLSALVFGGNPRRIVERIGVDLQAAVSEEMYSEMRRAVARKFPAFRREYALFEALLRSMTMLVPLGAVTVTACRDSRDNHVLETAVLGLCSCVITGDKDLLDMRSYEKILILTPADFLKK